MSILENLETTFRQKENYLKLKVKLFYKPWTETRNVNLEMWNIFREWNVFFYIPLAYISFQKEAIKDRNDEKTDYFSPIYCFITFSNMLGTYFLLKTCFWEFFPANFILNMK
jgi:hypothetical protein